jgi:hypothetical protein
VHRSLRGLAIALYLQLGFCALVSVFAFVTVRYRAARWDDVVHGRWISGDPDRVNQAVHLFWRLYPVAEVALMVTFVIWFHRARTNVEWYPGARQQSLPRGWAIGGWFCPVVNLWFPPMITQEVWRAADPRAPLRGGATPGRLVLVWGWWIAFIGSGLLALGARCLRRDGDGEADPIAHAETAHTAATVLAWGFVSQIVAVGLVVVVIARITGFQSERERAMGGAVFGPPMPAPVAPAFDYAVVGRMLPPHPPGPRQVPARPGYPPAPR